MFVDHRKVKYSEVAKNGFMNVAQIADYFQDCSVQQSDKLGVGVEYLEKHQLAWVLAAWQIQIEYFPQLGEMVEVGTWPYAFDAGSGYRNFIMLDDKGNQYAVANSQWMLVDVKNGFPKRITDEVVSHYPLEEKADMNYTARKISYKKNELIPMEPIRVMRSYIDTNQHMNNAWYIRLAAELLAESFVVHQVRVEFKRAALEGQEIIPYLYQSDQVVQVVLGDEKRNPYAIVEFSNE